MCTVIEANMTVHIIGFVILNTEVITVDDDVSSQVTKENMTVHIGVF